MSTTADNTIDLGAEIARLESRKSELQRMLALQDQVAALELRLMLSETDLCRAARTIALLVAQHFGISLPLLMSTARPNRIAIPRMFAMHLAYTLTGASCTAVAEVFGKDHTSVLHAEKTVTNLAATRIKWKHDLEELTAKAQAALNLNTQPTTSL